MTHRLVLVFKLKMSVYLYMYVPFLEFARKRTGPRDWTKANTINVVGKYW